MVMNEREKQVILQLKSEIATLTPNRPITIMEVCGTHTMSVYRYSIRSLLPKQVKLVSGPGCPVCVTDSRMISAALAIATQRDVIFTSFGDMLRVPAGNTSLLTCRDQGADVRIVLSPLEALTIAKENPQKEIVFFAVGFETTAPLIAATVQAAKKDYIKNFSILVAHKTMPQALRLLLGDAGRIDALLCPGHVAAVTGTQPFAFVAEELKKPAAICGFSACDILLSIRELVRQVTENRAELVNCYPRVVKEQGNPTALQALQQVFCPCDAVWRGLGNLPGSGLSLRPEYQSFDAGQRFADAITHAILYQDNPACCCGRVLRGELRPEQCPLFGKVCTPSHPVGACMVSGEGSCAAAYKYREV